MTVSLDSYNCKTVTDEKTLKLYDRWAENTIKGAENMIKAAKEYRLQLAESMVQLHQMNLEYRLSLRRQKQYNGKVYYYLKIEKVYEDGTAATTESRTNPGIERHKAIAEYNRLVKINPRWEQAKDIEKGRWE